MKTLTIDYIPISDIKPYKHNAKLHPPEQIQQIANSIYNFGMNDPIAIDENNVIIEGHGRLLAIKQLLYDGQYPSDTVPVIRLDHLTDQQKKAYVLAHNKLTLNSGFDIDILNKELKDITEFDMNDFGFPDTEKDMMDRQRDEEQAHITLSDKFLIPPFSILDSRTQRWQDRKRAWKTLIQDDGSARQGADLLKHMSSFAVQKGPKKFSNPALINSTNNGASLLDPVLAEIITLWYSPKPENGVNVFDCFAGDTVFGYVSSYLHKNFTGIELRQEQVDYNQTRLTEAGLNGKYICDDGRNVAEHVKEKSQDLFFSCPPYYDMEVYSDKENDASNQKTYKDFYKILDTAFTEAGKCLKDNRFAVVVASDIRNKKSGGYYDFTGDIKDTFKRNGFLLYNELTLIRQPASQILFANNSMKTRKVRRTHEDVLVFFKGDPKKIKEEYGTEFTDFLLDRQNDTQHENILVFFKGDPDKIRDDYGEVETEAIFDEGED